MEAGLAQKEAIMTSIQPTAAPVNRVEGDDSGARESRQHDGDPPPGEPECSAMGEWRREDEDKDEGIREWEQTR